MGHTSSKGESPKASVTLTKLEVKIIESMRKREVEGSTLKSFNRIILKFPKIDESLRKIRATFQEFGKSLFGVHT